MRDAADVSAATPVIDALLVRRLVASQLPQWADLPVAAVEPQGWDNRTFRLGSELAVRLPSAEAYAAQVDKEQRWLPVLAPQLPLPVPVPLAQGAPGQGFPWPWSVNRWLDGEPVSDGAAVDLDRFATALADFLVALRAVDPAGGPHPGPHNFWRGGPLATYAQETVQAVEGLGGSVPRDRVLRVWDAAMAATWQGEPVWFHGDVAAGNLLLRGGRLCAVLDFGACGVGDPACDLAIAWTLLSGSSRTAFRSRLGVDQGTWARGRGWALWKALITLAGDGDPASDEPAAAAARRVVAEVLADHEQEG